MLTEEMQSLIRTHTAGFVATVRADGSAAVSPKATFVVVDDRTIACGNIRSPGTVGNLRRNAACEICFLDPLTRKAVRVAGNGTVISKAVASNELTGVFEQYWGDFLQHMTGFMVFDLTSAELILSPAYDLGATEQELATANKAKMAAL
ncbi:MAG: pyridoxamine 5'-phosphate oxidase family protein [Pseudomonadota bacterium]